MSAGTYVVASLMFGPYGKFPGLAERLAELEGHVARMARKAREKTGRGPDIVALPEVIVSGGILGDASECSFELEGPVLDAMSRVAREHRTYLSVPLYLAEDGPRGLYRNSVALLDRAGKLVGLYHKIHPVIGQDGRTLEGGVIPGTAAPVFACDFGKVGFQICFDITYDDGWAELGKKGADLVIWPTQSPATVRPATLAGRERYFVLSSTWRNNASLFEPTGMVAAQIREPEDILVAEIPGDWMILPWSHKLDKGKHLEQLYGAAVGYRYYESEDCGLFWSNDPLRSIRDMAEEAGLTELDALTRRNTLLQEKTRR